MNSFSYLIILFLSLSIENLCWGQNSIQWDSKFQLSQEFAGFENDHINESEDFILSLVPRFSLEAKLNSWSLRLGAGYRYDFFDANRDQLMMDENYLALDSDNLLVKIGLLKYNLSVLEVFHPVDIINTRQVDVLRIDDEKQAEPSLNIKILGESYYLQFLYLPYFIETVSPDNSSRLGIGLNFDHTLVVNEKNKKIDKNQWVGDQYGLIFQKLAGNWEGRFGYLRMIDKTFSLVGINEADLNRYHFQANHWLLTNEYAFEKLILKTEWVYKNFDNTAIEVLDFELLPAFSLKSQKPLDHQQVAVGLEYPFEFLSEQSGNIFLEYMALIGNKNSELERYSFFQNDLAIGYRHRFNDFQNKVLLISAIIDLSAQADQVYVIRFEQDLLSSLKFESGLRVVEIKKTKGSQQGLNDDLFKGMTLLDKSDHLYMVFTYYWD